nr:hypothetical protein [uncultured Campylobacter sp.]
MQDLQTAMMQSNLPNLTQKASISANPLKNTNQTARTNLQRSKFNAERQI